MIESSGNCCLVGVAESGQEARNLMGAHHPQLVFSEAYLGSESGIEICKAIKEDYPESSTYIVSNYRNMDLVDKAMRSGMEKYLLKPISRDTLTKLCVNQKEEVHEEDETLKELIQSVEEKDYSRAYKASKVYVDKIFMEMDHNGRKKSLKEVASSLLYMVPGLDRSQHDYYIQKNKLTVKILSKNVLSCCWIMEIVSEVFRQLCVMKYGHMNRVLQYIENNKNNEISLSDLSEQAGVSSGYLSRIFKKYYHISVVDYIHLRKLLIAKQYMVSSEMNISDISFLLGYSEAGYFCKIFKKYEEMTPSAFHHSYA